VNTIDYRIDAYLEYFDIQAAGDAFLAQELRRLSLTFGNSMQLQIRQSVINALAASATTSSIANDVSGAADDMTVDAVKASFRDLHKQGAVGGGKHVLLTSVNGYHHLTDDPLLTSEDTFSKKSMRTGMIEGALYGFDRVMPIADDGAMKLPLSGLDRTSFGYHTDAIVGVIKQAPEIMPPVWDGDKLRWVFTGILSIDAKELDAKGVSKILTDET
jgi:hypothetical protein